MPSPVCRNCQQTPSLAARRNWKQTAEQIHLHNALLPSAALPTNLPVLPQGETGGRRPSNYICTMRRSRLPRAANRLACFADRPNWRQLAEQLHLYDALLPSAALPTNLPVLPTSETGGRRPRNYICTMHRSHLPYHQPTRQFCRKAKLAAAGRAITPARCAAPVCPAPQTI